MKRPNSILKISEAASLALHAMSYIAANGADRPVTVRELATALSGSEAHLSKVLQRLTRTGHVTATRGPKGGVSLATQPDSITLLSIFEAIDGRIELNTCILREHACADGKCMFGDLLGTIHRQVHDYFHKARLSHVSHGFKTSPRKRAKE